MDDNRLEIKVGALGLAALAVAVGLVALLAGVRVGSSFSLQVDFGYAGGVAAGSVVKIAGVKAGRVTGVQLRPDARDADGSPLPVRVLVELDRSAAEALHADALATVAAQGALGETCIELTPGRAPDRLADGATLRGLDPPRLDVLLARVSQFFADAENEEAFRSFLVEVARLAHAATGLLGENREEVVEFFKSVSETLDAGKHTVLDARLAVQDARLALADIKGAARSANVLLSSPEFKGLFNDLSEASKTARAELPGVLRDTRALIANLQKTSGALNEGDVEKIKATIAKYDALATDLKRVSTSADAILAGIQKGEGTAGQLVKDPKVYQDLRDLLDDLKKHPWKFLWKD